MSILDIIAKKRDKKNLTKEEIDFFIKGYTNNEITDYQAAALIMAIFINGMTDEELYNLTFSMANSGEILDLSEFGENVVDKHSTGGVGDKVSIVLLPIIASFGIPVAKMSGRGLGFTGGTVDKLESIPGYNTSISIEEFKQNVHKTGISMIGQTLNLAPADKKIYSLRDSISCVDDVSLIASSIMSKKIAAGANKIVLEVTYGKGAFMKNIEDARVLANKMETLGKYANLDVESVFTPMDEPLGYAIGNTLEIIEAINFLKNISIPDDLKNAVLEIGSKMIKLAGKGDDSEKIKNEIIEKIESGKAFDKFKEMVQTQGGDISYLEDVNKFEKAKYIIDIKADKSGTIKEINAENIGKLACYLGAGRIKKEDKIDMSVGIIIHKKVGEIINNGEILATIHLNDISKKDIAIETIKHIIKID